MPTMNDFDTVSSTDAWNEVTVPQVTRSPATPARVPERRLPLLRYFAGIGLVSFLVVTIVLAVYYRRTTLHNLIHLAEEQNVVLTQTFANSLWPRFASFLPTVAGLDTDALRDHPEVLHLRTAVIAQMRDTTVVRVKIYDLQGRTVFSTEPSQIGSDQSDNPGILAALRGATTNELTYRNSFNAFDREIEHRNVLASYIPIRRYAGGPIEGVFELYDDITPLMQTMRRAQYTVIAVVSMVLALLFGALCLAARHADGVIRRQSAARADADRAREKLEAQLRHKQRMEAIGTLAGGIAHDFNNMLWVILACSEMGVRDLARNDPAREKLEEIKAAARRGSELVQQILTFSRQETQQRKPVRVAAVVEEALRLLDASPPSTVRIERHIASDAGEVLASSSQIHQMVINLVTNAAHASGEQGGVLQVKLAALDVGPGDPAPASDLRHGRYVRLTVSDSGCGMDEAVIGRIFDPFFTTKEVDEGVGMGLAIVHGIVAGMDGVIRVRSAPGRGSTFDVFLPRCDVVVAAAEDDGDSASAVSITPAGRILVVDDEPRVVKVLREMLEDFGCTVVALTDPDAALQAFEQAPESYDLVIVDQRMPRMSGMELSQRMTRIRPDLRIILTTGYRMPAPERIRACGIRDCVPKPIVRRDLGLAMRRIFEPIPVPA